MNKNLRNAKHPKKNGGTKSILRKKSKNKTNKTKKHVQWDSSVVSPKQKEGRSRSRTKTQLQNK